MNETGNNMIRLDKIAICVKNVYIFRLQIGPKPVVASHFCLLPLRLQ